MDKILERFDDQLIRGTYAYLSNNDQETALYAYADKECTQKIDADTLYDSFLKGLNLVSENVNILKPISGSLINGVCRVVVNIEGNRLVVYSKEYDPSSGT